MIRNRMWHRPVSATKRLFANNSGNVALTFALSILPLIFLTGMAVDFTSAISKRAQLNAAADAAALAAIAPATASQPTATAQAAAVNIFNALASRVKGVSSATPTVTITTSGMTRTATVSYTASSLNSFPNILAQAAWSISGTATASGSTPAYVNFYLLLDDSPSMGIGATPSDISAMQAANNGCAFACHSPNALNPSIYPGYTLPQVPGTQLRIDALVSATSQLISTAISQESTPNQFQIGLYTFDNSVTTVADLTTNLKKVQTLNSAIVLPVTDVGTQMGDAVNWLAQNKIASSAGTGTKQDPLQFVFFVTDGAEDHAFNYTSGSYDTLQPPTGEWNGTPYASVIDTAACTVLKNKGVTLAVLYLNYDPLSDIRYVDMVQPYVNNIIPALQTCASPNFFFQADHASDIGTAMQQMFAQALAQTARLTQ